MAGNAFYKEEFLDVFPKILIRFNPQRESQELLVDVVLTIHVMLKLLSTSTTKLFFKKKRQSRRQKKRAKAAQPKSKGAPTAEEESASSAAQQQEPGAEGGAEPFDPAQVQWHTLER